MEARLQLRRFFSQFGERYRVVHGGQPPAQEVLLPFRREVNGLYMEASLQLRRFFSQLGDNYGV
jgi:hypothetical protein